MKKLLIYALLTGIFSVYMSAQGGRTRVTIVDQKEQTTIDMSCVPQKAFGMQFGIGNAAISKNLDPDLKTTSVQWSLNSYINLHEYFGLDIRIINSNINFKNKLWYDDFTRQQLDYFGLVFQPVLVGLRGNSPTFYKCMYGYLALRLGYGILAETYSYKMPVWNWTWDREDIEEYETQSWVGHGVSFEFEFGINLGRKVYIGYVFNRQGGTKTMDETNLETDINVNGNYFRLGFFF